MNTSMYTVDLTGIGPVEVTVADYGSGQPFLLLHGGAGPQSVTGFAEKFAAAHDVRVLVPTHPGFGGTPRPEALDSVGGLAALSGAGGQAAKCQLGVERGAVGEHTVVEECAGGVV
jgi:pimeloyl-ACP methyl ester carboxylesterase